MIHLDSCILIYRLVQARPTTVLANLRDPGR